MQHSQASPPPRHPANRQELLLVALVLSVATGLRLTLALLNDEANDDHLGVVRMLLDGWRDLSLRDCHECFHPKLYYAVVTLLVRGLGVTTDFFRLRLGQLLNAGAGVLTCWIIYRFLLRQQLSTATRVLVLALVALNPAFLAINGQFSNDSFAILFSVAGIYWTTRFAQEQRPAFFGLAATCLVLAFATKATAWVCGVAAVLSLLVAAAAHPQPGIPRPRRNLLWATVLAVALMSTIGFAGYDFKSYDDYARHGKNAQLHFFQRTSAGRPGVVSVYDSYLSFKLIDLLQHPYTSNGWKAEPAHRTSVFSQLYGRLQFLHLDCWPRSWELKDWRYHHVGRFNIAFGLVPTALFLLGLGLALRRQGAALSLDGPRQWLRSRQEPALLCLLLCLGHLGFIVLFTASHRDYASMKPIYMFAGMLGFVGLLADGCQYAFDRLSQAKLARRMLQAALALLVLGYVADVLVLAGQLLRRNGPALASSLGLG
jgi:hypothetical protein